MFEMNTSEWLCYFLRDGKNGSPGDIETVNWSGILFLAQRHGVAPLLYYRLKNEGFQDRVPEQTFQALQQAYLLNAARNIRLYHELAQILTGLKEHNIPVIVLKGAYLAETAYENIALRSMGDIDLLVQKKDLAESQQVLLQAGYLSQKSRVAIDMHWNIDLSIANLPIDRDNLWERANVGRLAGVEVYTLSPEDLLLHICTHLAFHHDFQRAGLQALYDIKTTIQHYSDAIRWEQLVTRAEEWKVCHALYLSLFFAKELLRAKVPDDTMDTLKPAEIDPQIYSWIKIQILQGTSEIAHVSPFFWRIWTPVPFSEKIFALYHLIFPSKEHILQKYPKASLGSFKGGIAYLRRFREHFLLYSDIMWKILSNNRQVRLQIQQQQKLSTFREWLVHDER